MVDALGGAPGIYSARYAGEDASDAVKIEKLLYEMKDVPEKKRTAKFVSAICCCFPNGEKLFVRGECPGKIAMKAAGKGGFGYDPVFLVENGMSYAQLSGEEKDAISHRGMALRLLSEKLPLFLKERGIKTDAE